MMQRAKQICLELFTWEGQERYTRLNLNIKILTGQVSQFSDWLAHFLASLTAAKDARIEEEVHSPTENKFFFIVWLKYIAI